MEVRESEGRIKSRKGSRKVENDIKEIARIGMSRKVDEDPVRWAKVGSSRGRSKQILKCGGWSTDRAGKALRAINYHHNFW
jgi:hypothetical protein